MSDGAAAPSPAAGGWRRGLVLAAKLAVACGLLAWVVASVDLADVWRQVRRAAPWPLVVSLAVYLGSLLFHAWRWGLLLAARGVELSLPVRLRLILAASFFNLFLPGNLSGDVYRVVGARPAAASMLQSAGVVIVERYCGFLATFLMALGGLAMSDFARREPWLTGLVVALFAAFLVPLAVGSSRRAMGRLAGWSRRFGLERAARLVERTGSAWLSFARRPDLIASVVALSMAMKLCVAVILWLLAVSLGLSLPLHVLLVFLPLHTVVSALPISLNGLGTREANMVGFLVAVGLSADGAASLAFLHLAWLYATGLPGGLLLLGRRQR